MAKTKTKKNMKIFILVMVVFIGISLLSVIFVIPDYQGDNTGVVEEKGEAVFECDDGSKVTIENVKCGFGEKLIGNTTACELRCG